MDEKDIYNKFHRDQSNGLKSGADLPPPSKVADYIGIKYAQCAETNEKIIFRFLFFEL